MSKGPIIHPVHDAATTLSVSMSRAYQRYKLDLDDAKQTRRKANGVKFQTDRELHRLIRLCTLELHAAIRVALDEHELALNNILDYFGNEGKSNG